MRKLEKPDTHGTASGNLLIFVCCLVPSRGVSFFHMLFNNAFSIAAYTVSDSGLIIYDKLERICMQVVLA